MTDEQQPKPNDQRAAAERIGAELVAGLKWTICTCPCTCGGRK